ncbi:dihydrolipoyl dehydrogenase family protein [Campylobacter gastrosuis]|uniref:NAD(P)/FAD-dependent oxidoreductase n=1 Tax=Campylobacter gastrosuis TaxID=2974576 RepID=A0ABT7HMI2_9BACT|nr:NAD(P)/FAD-dependent oxidoreductase [Campylobacter gastrosuis]MDL0088124.1 NAD(P)/FAD-dependent oxidoreductase [Campylobacter gastrosuis]
MKHYDIAILGFGKAGKTLAVRANALNKSVAVVEKSAQMYGGTCINVGCIPTKKLITLSKMAKFHENKDEFFKKAVGLKNELILALRAKNFAMLDSLKNVEVITQTASFVDKNTILLSPSGEKITADKIIINTGSKSIKPNFSVKSDIVYQSDEILELGHLPKHLVVVGGGFIGLEMASMFANFGSKVSVVLRSEILKNEDDDVREVLIKNLENQGVNFIQNAKISEINGDKIYFNDSFLEADAFLLSLGRTPNIDDLELKNAGVLVNKRGGVATDECLRSEISDIFAVGDARGDEFFTYISLDDFRIVNSYLFGDKTRTKNNRSPYAKVLFTDTPFAKIGLSEREAGENVKVLKVMMQNVPNAKILGNDTGFLKAICDKASGEILGASFICANAHEIINEIAIAMKFRAKASDLAGQIFTHPSTSEALNDLFSQF